MLFRSPSIPWGHLSIFGSENSMSVFSTKLEEPNLASIIELSNGERIEFNDFGPYLPNDHIHLGDPHVFADVMFFIECITSDKDCYKYARQACHVIEVIEKGYESAKSGNSIFINDELDKFN